MYEPESLASLRQKVQLLEVLQAHIELKRSGGIYQALCPFHDEKTPSFMLKAGDQHFHCFGCGAHGDAIDFIMRFKGVGFSEAVETLAERYGMHLERRRGRQEEEGSSRARQRECVAQAAKFFHFWLLTTQEGASAREYLAKRGLRTDLIERFQLGWAPARDGILRRYLLDRQFSEGETRAVGLSNSSGRDFFRERIIFPILDAFGRPIAFSGRKIREETFGGKYINSPETSLFHKSRTLFGLSESRRQIAKSRKAVIVEGQVDALRLIAAGLDITCAPLGTAFGPEHAAELQKLGARSIYLAFDSDDAGRAAAIKAGHVCQKRALDVRVVELPQEVDPDSLVREEGIAAFVELMDHSRDFIEFLFHRAGDWSKLPPGAKQEWVEQTAAEIRDWGHEIVVHESLKRLAWLAKVPETALLAPPKRMERKKPRPQRSSEGVEVRETTPERAMEGELIASLLRLAQSIHWREVRAVISESITPSDLRFALASQALAELLRDRGDAPPPSLSALISAAPNENAARFYQELGERALPEERVAKQCRDSLHAIARRNWMTKREAIKLEIQSGTLSDQEAMEKAQELAQLIQSPPKAVELPAALDQRRSVRPSR